MTDGRPSTTALTLHSTAFEDNAYIPERYTCEEENENPPLDFFDPPDGTRSFAIIMHDPDATRGDFTHWVIWNIDPETREIKAGMVPEGAIEGKNDAGRDGYTGPCPPVGSGIHHYHFVLMALDNAPELSPGSTREALLKVAEGHELARVTLIGLYERE
jgi:Raf kinase inhibitor-like YbhB/YbcL family protein